MANRDKQDKSALDKPTKWHIRTRAPKNKSLKQKKNAMRQYADRKMFLPDWVIQILGSLLVTLIVETLTRRSLAGAFEFIANNPLAFVLNWSMVALFIAMALMFRRRLFALVIASFVWIALAAVNYTIMSRRGRLAFYPADLHGIGDGIVVIPKLFTWWQVALIAGGVILAVAGLVVLLLHTRAYRRDLQKGWLRLMTTAFVFTLTLLICLENNLITRNLRPDFYASYKQNGFSYSFLFGIFDTGMETPNNYKEEAVDDIMKKAGVEIAEARPTEEPFEIGENGRSDTRLGWVTEDADIEGYNEALVEKIEAAKQTEAVDSDLPNIVILQLEAFCKPEQLKEYAYEGDPIPNFRRLSSEYTSGSLGVPTVAGGTCNTEFEVLSGCNLDLFGANEYPFYGLVKENGFESLATELKPLGYTSTFLHNYSGTFYNRNLVYANLGFDRFVSIEFMNDYEETEVGWAKDDVLRKYILKSLETSEGRDLIMTVGVQTHSAYPPLSDEEARFIATAAPNNSENDRLSFQYYLEQLSQVDDFIGQLVKDLSAFDEKTMLIVYGDHLPGIRLNHDKMTTEELFSTSYFIWTNYETETPDRDLEAYQVGAYALKMAGIHNCGAMITVHQNFMDNEPDSYMNIMKTIQYDITYGDHYWYGGGNVVREDEMRFGVEPVTVEDWQVSRGNLFVLGHNFTQDAVIYINGSAVNTIYVSDDMLLAPGEEYDPAETLEVRFFGADGVLLATSALPMPEPAQTQPQDAAEPIEDGQAAETTPQEGAGEADTGEADTGEADANETDAIETDVNEEDPNEADTNETTPNEPDTSAADAPGNIEPEPTPDIPEADAAQP